MWIGEDWMTRRDFEAKRLAARDERECAVPAEGRDDQTAGSDTQSMSDQLAFECQGFFEGEHALCCDDNRVAIELHEGDAGCMVRTEKLATPPCPYQRHRLPHQRVLE